MTIKNCPRCNKPPILMKTYDRVCGYVQMYYVKCDACGIRTYTKPKQAEAAEAWNTEKGIIEKGGVFK